MLGVTSEALLPTSKMYGCHACSLSTLAKSSGVLLLFIKTEEFCEILLFFFAIGFKEILRLIRDPLYSVLIADCAITALCLFGQIIYDLYIGIGLFKEKQGYFDKRLMRTAVLYTIQCFSNIFSLLYHAYKYYFVYNDTAMNISHGITSIVSVTKMLICGTLLLVIKKFYIAVRDGKINQTTGSNDVAETRKLVIML